MKKQDSFSIDGLYCNRFSNKTSQGNVLYIHGGPGNHSAYFEQALLELPAYKNLNHGWITYDQRSCGRSEKHTEKMTHDQNLKDLEKVLEFFKNKGVKITALCGHSYGSLLLYDFIRERKDLDVKTVYLGRARKMNTSRDRALMMNLLLLKMNQPDDYQVINQNSEHYEKSIWSTRHEIRKKLKNPDDKKYFYWGNLDSMKWYEAVKENVGIPESMEIFAEITPTISIKDSGAEDFEIRSLPQESLWIHGFHDFLMGGDTTEPNPPSPELLYYHSGHYPHLEEPERFVSDLNSFLGGKENS